MVKGPNLELLDDAFKSAWLGEGISMSDSCLKGSGNRLAPLFRSPPKRGLFRDAFTPLASASP
jgi:hypothetical protein